MNRNYLVFGDKLIIHKLFPFIYENEIKLRTYVLCQLQVLTLGNFSELLPFEVLPSLTSTFHTLFNKIKYIKYHIYDSLSFCLSFGCTSLQLLSTTLHVSLTKLPIHFDNLFHYLRFIKVNFNESIFPLSHKSLQPYNVSSSC